ncbi:hypothetical protein Emag_007337 [Eimeria magna]
MQTVRAEDQGVGDVGYKEISFGLCVFVAPPVVRDVLRYRAHLERRAGGYPELYRLIQRLLPRQEPRSRPAQSWVTPLRSEEQVPRRFPRRRAGGDNFPLDYCPPYVLYSRTAFRRMGLGIQNLTFASPTLWEGPHFAEFRGFPQENAFAVLGGPERLMKSGEPCWLVVGSLRDEHREMVYDRAMHEIFPHHDLRRFVEILPPLCPRNMDMEYSYAVAPYRAESGAQVNEDYARLTPPSREDLRPSRFPVVPGIEARFLPLFRHAQQKMVQTEGVTDKR